MKKWIENHKKTLVIFSILSTVTFALVLLEVNYILSNLNDLEEYAKTGIVTSSLKGISVLGLLDVALITAWTCIFVYLLLKVIFPNKKTVRNAFFIDELLFIKNVPSMIKGRLDKD